MSYYQVQIQHYVEEQAMAERIAKCQHWASTPEVPVTFNFALVFQPGEVNGLWDALDQTYAKVPKDLLAGKEPSHIMAEAVEEPTGIFRDAIAWGP